MSSTELPRRLAAEIEGVFAALEAAAAAARERGAPAVPLTSDEALVSYYVPTPALPPPFEELPAEGAAAWLAEHWTGQGWPELAALAPRLVALARALADEQRAQPSGDVSPLIYQMF